MKKLILPVLLTLFSLPVQAKTVWSCFTKQGKQILVTQEGADYRYHFGTPEKWELVFSNPLAQPCINKSKQNAAVIKPRFAH